VEQLARVLLKFRSYYATQSAFCTPHRPPCPFLADRSVVRGEPTPYFLFTPPNTLPYVIWIMKCCGSRQHGTPKRWYPSAEPSRPHFTLFLQWNVKFSSTQHYSMFP